MSKKSRKKAPVIVQQGAPEWMVTFGDLMALLLTFFVMLFSVSELKNDELYAAGAWREDDREVKGESGLFSDLIDHFKSLVSESPDLAPDSPETEVDIDPVTMNESPEPIEKVDDDLSVDIELSVSFEPGSAILSKEADEQIQRGGIKLGGAHTRVRVIGYATPSNQHNDLELAIQRATIVRNRLIEAGVEPLRLEAAARTNSKLNNEVLSDPIRLADRDRVIVILTPEYVEGLPAADEPNSVPNGEVGRKNR